MEDTVTLKATIDTQAKTIADHEATIAAHVKTISDQAKTIADHEATIAAHVKTISEQEDTIADQEATIAAHVKTISEQEDTIADKEATIDQKTADIISQAAAIKKLHAGNPEEIVTEKKPEPKKKTELPKEPVECNGKNWKPRLAVFYYKGIRYEAQDLVLDKKLVAEIVADPHQTVLREVF